MVHSPSSNICGYFERGVSPISDIWSNQAVFRVVDFFCSVCQLVLSILSALFFFALIAHDFKTFSKILLELDMQRSKTLQLSACFHIVNVFGLPMWIIVRLQVL